MSSLSSSDSVPVVAKGPLQAPAVILAADHRARGVITIEPYRPLRRRAQRRPRVLRRHPGVDTAPPRPGRPGRHRGPPPHLSLAQPHGPGGQCLRARRPSRGERGARRRRRLDRRQAHDAHRPDRPVDRARPRAPGQGAGIGRSLRARSARSSACRGATARSRATPTRSSSPPSWPMTSEPRSSRCPSPTWNRARRASTRWRASWPVSGCRCSSSVVPDAPIRARAARAARAAGATHGKVLSKRSATSWPGGRPGWPWGGSSTRTPTPRPWRVSWPRRCTRGRPR